MLDIAATYRPQVLRLSDVATNRQICNKKLTEYPTVPQNRRLHNANVTELFWGELIL